MGYLLKGVEYVYNKIEITGNSKYNDSYWKTLAKSHNVPGLHVPN